VQCVSTPAYQLNGTGEGTKVVSRRRHHRLPRFRFPCSGYWARGSDASGTLSVGQDRPSFFCRRRIRLAEFGSRTALSPASLRSRFGGHPRTALAAQADQAKLLPVMGRKVVSTLPVQNPVGVGLGERNLCHLASPFASRPIQAPQFAALMISTDLESGSVPQCAFALSGQAIDTQ